MMDKRFRRLDGGGNEEGLDPLAMLNAIEVVYQDLLPGMRW